MGDFKIGVHVMTYGATWPEAVAFAQEVDRLGFDFLLMHDHLLATQGDYHQPFFESYTTLGAWATLTRQVKLGHLTVGNPFRNPGVVAKATATLDHISNGRMTLCLGAGSLPEEFPPHGLAVGQTLGDRLQALDESLSIVTRILAGEEVTFSSSNYHFDRIKHRPVPLQSHVPVFVGATGEKVGLKIAAKYADYWQMSVSADSGEQFRRKSEVLEQHCATVGRDAGSIARMPEIATVLRETEDIAERAFRSYATHFAWSQELIDYNAKTQLRGTPEEVAERLRPIRDVGIDGLIYQALPPYDYESIRRFATELKPILAADARRPAGASVAVGAR
jgi:alkanesulfonate monooxygenase SsuD/methylene tetrahydromethanopterin reductase-like flavin-dependent oxidoreductase (luciferase family)